MTFENNNKNPNELHDYLINNDCEPITLCHNAIYDDDGNKATEATEIYIEIESEKQELLTNLVNSFMSQ